MLDHLFYNAGVESVIYSTPVFLERLHRLKNY